MPLSQDQIRALQTHVTIPPGNVPGTVLTWNGPTDDDVDWTGPIDVPDVRNFTGDPNGVVFAPMGTLGVERDVPALWQNTDGVSAWSQLGGGSFPDFTGSGSPEGVVTATIGKSYVDTTNGALYWKMYGSGNIYWITADNITGFQPQVPGVSYASFGPLFVAAAGGGDSVRITDVLAQNGGGDALTWHASADTTQYLDLRLGGSAHFWYWLPDGSMKVPGWIYNVSGQINGAPASGDLAAGDYVIWFDDTAGAAKLMVKAKNASGTVVTGSIALT